MKKNKLEVKNMSNKTSKIKKATIFHSIYFKTLQVTKALRYSLSLFISGIIFMAFSSQINSDIIKSPLQILATILIILGIYSFPYLEIEKIDKFFNKFMLYLALFLFFLIYSMFWFALCSIDTSDKHILLFIVPLSIIEIVIMVPFINYTIKPIIDIISKISLEIKERAKKNEESAYVTYLKSFCANVSIVISFILTVITFLTTISSIINPSEIISIMFS